MAEETIEVIPLATGDAPWLASERTLHDWMVRQLALVPEDLRAGGGIIEIQASHVDPRFWPSGMFASDTTWVIQPADDAREEPQTYTWLGPDGRAYTVHTTGEWVESGIRRYLRVDLPEGEQIPCGYGSNAPDCERWLRAGWFSPPYATAHYGRPGYTLCDTCMGPAEELKRSR